MNYYIAVAAECADRTAIFATGDTPESAVKAAAEWTGGDTEGLTALPCTPALRAEVEEHGTPFSWGALPDGTQCTEEEEEEEEEED